MYPGMPLLVNWFLLSGDPAPQERRSLAPQPVGATACRVPRCQHAVGVARMLVRARAPSAVTERYVAEIQKGDDTMAFRCSLDDRPDGVFDHMLTTFQ